MNTSLPAARPETVGFDADRLNRMDAAMQAEIDAGHYAGISVQVARHGKLVKSELRIPVAGNRCATALVRELPR